jgi:hypothetical protein
VRLFHACTQEFTKFCDGHSPGSLAGHSCIEQNRRDAKFGGKCRCAAAVNVFRCSQELLFF